MSRALSWRELLALRPVAAVAAILDQRWDLVMGHADTRARATLGARRRVGPGGLCDLATPIVVDGVSVGMLTCGSYLPEDVDADPPLMDPVLAAAAAELDPVPVLDPDTEALVGDLLTLAAGEIAAHLRDRGLIPSASATSERRQYAGIVGASAPMQELYQILDRVVPSDTTVLIQGENGTGKELVARAIHELSPRRDRRFVVTNCSAFHDNLLDSELFGHKRGAFTGAVTEKPGLFEVADGGTFFLDEIGDMSPALQVKVLRVLQEGTFTPVGDTELRHVDVRVLAATNRDLEAMVAAGRFREDLYYRIKVINLRLPPLREREGDIERLAAHFLAKHHRGDGPPKTLSPACLDRLLRYHWPGNVRELENEIERLVVFSGAARIIDAEHLSPRVSGAPRPTPAAPVRRTSSLPEALRELERRMIRDALERHGWNKTRAAVDLHISRRNLIRLVQKYDLEADRKP
ncbi:sigma 54-interacting transcriptional regulator [Haliangium sp.]|uniref:sigma 54-interacting transcriptional regulator n=1 Tax=Haliangium sp. TaxID=2663208 RepID=UPI003D0E71BA